MPDSIFVIIHQKENFPEPVSEKLQIAMSGWKIGSNS